MKNLKTKTQKERRERDIYFGKYLVITETRENGKRYVLRFVDEKENIARYPYIGYGLNTMTSCCGYYTVAYARRLYNQGKLGIY